VSEARCAVCGSVLPAPGVPCARCLLGLGLDTEEPAASTTRREQIGPYKILDTLGQGGMGVVYLAEQSEPINRRVALKIIKPGLDDAQILARFAAERQALALLAHPGIAKILDAGATPDGRPYVAMEYVQGAPITAFADAERLGVRERLELFAQVCDAVQHAHQKGIIHRDIKPTNVLVGRIDDRPIAKVIDFGVAKATGMRLADQTFYTARGIVVGTPEYMSPEQANPDGGEVDTRTDIYALGVLLYELLVGVVPFERKFLGQAAIVEMLRVIREDDPPRLTTRIESLGATASDVAHCRRSDPRSLARQLRGELEWITIKALEKDPARRYASASEFAIDVRRHLADEPVLAGPPTLAYKVRKFVARHPVGVGASVAIAVLLVALVVGLTAFATRLARERARADREAGAAKSALGLMTGIFKVADPSEARGNSITAREVLDRSVKSIGTDAGGDPEVRATLLYSLATIYKNLGLYGASSQVLEQALELRRSTLGPEHPETLRAASDTATLLRLRSRFEEAEPIGRATLEARRRVLGNRHPDTLESVAELCMILQVSQHGPEAEPLCIEAYEGRREVLGPDHIDTLTSDSMMGRLYLVLNDGVKAEPFLRDALDRQRRVLGSDHPDTFVTMGNLTNFLQEVGKLEEAGQLARESLEGKQRVFGPDHPATLAAMYMTAHMLRRAGKPEEAEVYYRRAAEGRERVLGPDHLETLLSKHGWAACLIDLGRREEARTSLADTVERAKRTLGTRNAMTLGAMAALGDVDTTLGRLTEAEAILREALEAARANLPKGEDRLAKTCYAYGRCLTKLGRYAEAEPLLLEAHETLSKSTSAKVSSSAAKILTELYEAWPKPEQAAKWRAIAEEPKASSGS
jgi:eukaryotic-like serine/threonine-protein kinase